MAGHGRVRTRLLFQEDSYMKEFEATVVGVDDGKVVLDRTAFHPRPMGGLSNDTGILESGDCRLRVVDVIVERDSVVHIVEGDCKLSPGEKVRGVLDWERRYNMMKLHTASHILAALLYREYGALVTGGIIEPHMARDDFDLSMVKDWKTALKWAVEETNKIIKKCIPVKIYWIPREEALKRPELVKLADRTPPKEEKLRIVEIPGVDVQADGGPHVSNTCEIEGIEIVKMESKGRRRKRLYYTLTNPART
ncbi:MAG: alanyl-tRNA editing protein [Desulfurococcales archaeon]|nr:alanyl-tRNA editing protein [Desulfurococcales archaeon]